MELRRRFAFRGNAAAFGGRIVRPEDVVLEMPGASSLGIVGGRSVSNISGTPASFKDFVTFKSASTFAEGLFDDLKGLIALSNHEIQEDSLKSTTRVKAEIRTLTVGQKRRLTAARLAAEMLSQSPTGSGEPPIRTTVAAAATRRRSRRPTWRGGSARGAPGSSAWSASAMRRARRSAAMK